MKKALLIIGLVILVPIIIFILFNLGDAEPIPATFDKVKPLPATANTSANGFFILWGLCEPEKVDVLSEEYIWKVESLFNPPGNETQFNLKEYRDNFKAFSPTVQKMNFPNHFSKGWLEKILSQREAVDTAENVAAIMLRRYEKLIATPVFEDFTVPDFRSPIPNLLAWLQAAKLYISVNVLDAVDGEWEQGVQKLLAHIGFCKKVVANSRVLVLNLIGKASCRMSLEGLVSLMNHPQCPPEVYQQVLDGLTPLKYEDYGSLNSFIGECRMCYAMVDNVDSPDFLQGGERVLVSLLPTKLFLHPVRTKNYFTDFFALLIAAEKEEPYNWKQSFADLDIKLKSKKSWWWVSNPIGKMLHDIALPNITAVVTKSYELRTAYDMTRILADFHKHYSPNQQVKEVLDGLETYKVMDPCSGKPYMWSEKLGVIYSIGTDLEDDGGKYDFRKLKETDFAVPLVPKLLP
ncbi:MAG: hypothetical protein GY765_05685 [bacterium]|nr:hypothetical protein [bacterium]